MLKYYARYKNTSRRHYFNKIYVSNCLQFVSCVESWIQRYWIFIHANLATCSYFSKWAFHKFCCQENMNLFRNCVNFDNLRLDCRRFLRIVLLLLIRMIVETLSMIENLKNSKFENSIFLMLERHASTNATVSLTISSESQINVIYLSKRQYKIFSDFEVTHN